MLCEPVSTVLFQQGQGGYLGAVDTYLVQDAPNSARGTVAWLEWDGDEPWGSGRSTVGLLQMAAIFDADGGPIPAGSAIVSASLSYTMLDDGDDADFHEVLVPWVETVTWNSFGGSPGIGALDIGPALTIASGAPGSHSVDVTASLSAWSASPASNHGWLWSPRANDGAEVMSSEATNVSQRPSLTVTYFSGAPVCNADCQAQQATAALPACSGPVVNMFDSASIQPPGRNSGNYSLPSSLVTAALDASMAALTLGDAATAISQASAAGYTLCSEPVSADIALWMPTQPGSGGARFALRVQGARPIIVESPHPNYDTDSDLQAVLLFERLSARALVMSGTHRCGSFTPAGCSGTTSACGSSAPYRESDMAHTELSAFQAAHVFLADSFVSDWVLSVHGFSSAGVSVSDGTVGAISDQSATAQIGTALAAAFPGQLITSCNAYTGATVQSRLCGTTNTQGRHLNSSPNACLAAGTQSAGRFVHMEQSLSIRQQSAVQVSDAIDTVLGAAVN